MPEGKQNNLLESKAGMLIKTSLVDFPSRVASVVFLRGCNLRCPYCYNTALIDGSIPEDFVSLKEIISHLEKRKNLLTGLVISGGEALLNPRTEILIKEAKNLGYKIKVDTNGSLPQKLEQILNNEETRADYIAMDIKCSLEKLELLLPQAARKEEVVLEFRENIKKSISLLSSLPCEKREWRTVLVPSLVDEEGITKIAALLPKDANWYLANFQNGNCLDPRFNTLPPYDDEKLKNLEAIAQSIIPNAKIR